MSGQATSDDTNAGEWTPDAIDAEFNPLILCGLTNMGNTCYFNSGLQCLLNVGEMVSALKWCGNITRRHQEGNNRIRRKTPLATRFHNAFLGTMKEMDNNTAIVPRELVRELAELNPQFEGFQQQDAPEMVHTALGALEDATALDMTTEELLRQSGYFTSLSPSVSRACLTEEDIASAGGKSPTTPTPQDAIEDPSSRRFVDLLQFMHQVNSENERLEPGSFVPPRLVRSAPFDIFKGYSLNETTCNACGFTSRIIEAFTTLTVAIPTYKQRIEYAKLHPKNLSEKEKPKSTWNPFKLLIGCMASILRACGCWDDAGISELGPLTLDECLGIHFSPTILKGTNKYKCLVCKSKQEATHRTTLLELPDTCIIHLKRFEFGHYWTTKKSEYVEFPVDWTPSLPPESTLGLSSPHHHRPPETPTGTTTHATYVSPLLGEGEEKPTHHWLDLAQFCNTTVSLPRTSTYSLSGVINHHGSFSGGHYTCYAKKGDSGWALFNDHRVASVPRNDVFDSQGYLFFYKKQSRYIESEELRILRYKAQQYLIGCVNLDDEDDVRFVSRLWLHRMATYADAGPILNSMCYCDPVNKNRSLARGDQVPTSEIPESDQRRHFHCSSEWFYVPVRLSDWKEFRRKYGGGPTVDGEIFAGHVARERKWLAALAKTELHAGGGSGGGVAPGFFDKKLD